MQPKRLRSFTAAAAFAFACALASLVGSATRLESEIHASTELVAGVALAGLLVLGTRAWPAIALGLGARAVLAPSEDAAMHAALALTATAEALLAAYVLRKLAFDHALQRVRDVTALAIGGALFAGGAGALLHAAVVAVLGHAAWSDFFLHARSAWLADAIGILLVVPVVLARPARSALGLTAARVLEIAGVAALLTVMLAVVFAGVVEHPLAARWFWTFPALVWAAVRFGPGIAALANLAHAFGAVWAAAYERGPFAGLEPHEAGLLLHSAIAVYATVALLLAALFCERERARDDAARSARRVRTILDAEPGCVQVLDASGRIVESNAAGLVMFGARELDDVRGRSWSEFTKPADRERLATLLRGAADGVGGALELELVGLDRGPRHLDAHVVPFSNEADGARAVLVIAHDVSARRRAELELREALEFNRQVIASAREGVVVCDRALRIVLWNPFMEELSGLDAASVSGRTPWEVLPQLDEDDARARFAAALEGRSTLDPATRLVSRTGAREAWVSTSIAPLADARGDVTGVLALVHDVTEQRRAVHTLRASEERFALAVRGSNEGLWDLDVLTDAAWYSPHFKELLGYAEHELANERATMDALLHPDDRERVNAAREEHLESQVPFDVELRLRTRSGEHCWFRARGQAVWDEQGRPTRMAGSITDISDLKRNEQALREALEFNRQILASAREGIIVLDRELRYVLVNAFMEELAGFKERDAVGRRPWEVFPGLEKSGVVEMLRRALAGEITAAENFQPSPAENGAGAWISALHMPLRDASGATVGVLVLIRDVSDRRRAEDELRRSRERFELAVEGARDGIWDWDVLTGAAYLSPRWKELLGYADHEIENQLSSFQERLHPDDAEHVWSAARAHLELGTPYDVELRMTTRSGSYAWFRSRGQAVRDRDGRAVRMVGALTDITLLKETEQRIRELNEGLERRVDERARELRLVNEELRHFIHSLSHDLRSPLRAVSGYAQMLASRKGAQLDDEALRWAGNIVEGSVRMGRLIDDLLAYSRVGAKGVDPRPVPLQEILSALVRDLAPRVAAAGGRIEIAGALPVVRADATLLTQVFTNLLENAFHYRRRDVAVAIEVACEVVGPRARISVRDNGIGIAREHQERIFQVFERLHAQDEYPGTGMGLAIVRKAVHLLGGEVTVESRPSEGSTFSVALPLEIEAAAVSASAP